MLHDRDNVWSPRMRDIVMKILRVKISIGSYTTGLNNIDHEAAIMM